MRWRRTWRPVCDNNYRKPIDARVSPRHECTPSIVGGHVPARRQRTDHAGAGRYAPRPVRSAGAASAACRAYPDPSLPSGSRGRRTRGDRRSDDARGGYRLLRTAPAARQHNREASAAALAGQRAGRLAYHAMPVYLRRATGRNGSASVRRRTAPGNLEGAGRADEDHRRRRRVPVCGMGAGRAACQRGGRFQRVGRPPSSDALPRRVRCMGAVHPRPGCRSRLQVRNSRQPRPAGAQDRSLCAAHVPASRDHPPGDRRWMEARARFDWQHSPVSIYELHPGSWRRHADGSFYTWGELVTELIPYVLDLGYTHIELLPVAEHPLDASWGYQVSGYYAPTARFGSPDDFRAFVDACHQAGIGVLLDWVPAHFPKDDFALARFTGEPVYEHADPRRGEHQEWGTLVFDFGRNEVRNFLVANALYWLDEFHIDGLRVDAVASMLYLDYSRQPGEWLPNQYGGRENIEAVHFLREMNTEVHARFPGVLTIAEESTAWPAVSRPVELGGLGFSMKWNMGWMNDSLDYIEKEPIYRKYQHNQLTFSQMYAWTENFVLPLSHDEVVHMKKSLLDKMPGDVWQRFANLRLFYAWHYAHPGKKLLFMGSEFGQWNEWKEAGQLDWVLLEFPAHDSIRALLRDLDRLYRSETALHEFDFDPRGFRWIDCHDADQSVLSLVRQGQDASTQMVVLLNFTPVPQQNNRIGVPSGTAWCEVLNTDSMYYGGSNLGNGQPLHPQNLPWMGFDHSVEVTLPPLGAIFLI